MKWLLCWAVFVPLRSDGLFSPLVMCVLLLITDVVSVGVGGRGLVRAGHAAMSIVVCASDYVPTDVPIRADVTN